MKKITLSEDGNTIQDQNAKRELHRALGGEFFTRLKTIFVKDVELIEDIRQK